MVGNVVRHVVKSVFRPVDVVESMIRHCREVWSGTWLIIWSDIAGKKCGQTFVREWG